jgi:propionyl-CoA carboxylase beta chain
MVKDTSICSSPAPDVIKTVTHEEVTKDELGGAMTHNAKSAWHILRQTTMSTRSDNAGAVVVHTFEQPGRSAVRCDKRPVRPNRPGSEHDGPGIVEPALRYPRHYSYGRDEGYFFEIQEHYAQNIVIGFARLGGTSVGIVANQPAYLAGVLDIDASVKAARFVRFCDCLKFRLLRSKMFPASCQA